MSAPYAGKEGDDYYVYFDMWDGSDTVSVKDKVANSTISDDYDKESFITYTDEGNGIVDGVKAVEGLTDGAVVAYDGEIVKIAKAGGSDELKITDDTKIYYVNSEDVEGVEGGEIEMADEVAEGKYNSNVKYTVTNGDEVGVLFVDVNNDFGSEISYAG